MQYQLPADISQRLEACIAGGRFANEEEVLRKALDALEEREQNLLDRWHSWQCRRHGTEPAGTLQAPR